MKARDLALGQKFRVADKPTVYARVLATGQPIQVKDGDMPIVSFSDWLIYSVSLNEPVFPVDGGVIIDGNMVAPESLVDKIAAALAAKG